MKICVVSGSPKGEESATLQYVRFIEKAFPGHTFSVTHAGREIRSIEGQKERWEDIMAGIRESDGVLFATPVYYMLVPAQLKRFFELVGERDAGDAFSGKYTGVITTSIHFFDHTAHAYLQGICEDLGMHYTGYYSAHMRDLHSVECQKGLIAFFADLLEAISDQRAIQREYLSLPVRSPSYTPTGAPVAVDTHGKRVVIVHDAAPGSDLEAMVRYLAGCYAGPVTVAHIGDSMMEGGCLGCCRCAFDNTCVYTDGFRAFWEEHILRADILIIAGTIRDRYLSATWKQFFDRSFFKGHVPSFEGKQVGFLVEGPLAHLPNLREILVNIIGKANLAGIVTNESEDTDVIDATLQALARRSVRFADQGYVAPPTFPAIGGHKLFRDEIWGGMRAIFKADDKYYRRHGYYDFPTKDYLQRIGTRGFSLFLDIPGMRKRVEKDMTFYMVKSLKRSIEESRVLAERAGQG
jgi:multimeric flavodoxin WrbA